MYASDSTKTQKEKKDFYNCIMLWTKYQKEVKLFCSGTLKARIGKEVLNGMKNTFDREDNNESGEHLIHFSPKMSYASIIYSTETHSTTNMLTKVLMDINQQ